MERKEDAVIKVELESDSSLSTSSEDEKWSINAKKKTVRGGSQKSGMGGGGGGSVQKEDSAAQVEERKRMKAEQDRLTRANRTPEQRAKDAERFRKWRENMTPEQRVRERERQRQNKAKLRAKEAERIRNRRVEDVEWEWEILQKMTPEHERSRRLRERRERMTPEQRQKDIQRVTQWRAKVATEKKRRMEAGELLIEEDPAKREERLAKKRFDRLVKFAAMSEDEKKMHMNSRWLAKQAKIAQMTPEEKKAMLKKNCEQVKKYYKSLTGEKLEQVKMKQKEASRRQAQKNWMERPEKILEYCRKKVAEETPEQRQKRLRGYKINASRRKLKIELEEEGVLSPEEIKRQLKEFVDKLRSEPLPPLKPEEISEYKPRISGRKPKKTGRRWKEMIGDVGMNGGEAALTSSDRLQCSSFSARVGGVVPPRVGGAPKLNEPPVLFASVSSPLASKLKSLPQLKIPKSNPPTPPALVSHFDSPCNSPPPSPADSFCDNDCGIEPQLPTSAGEFKGGEALPILSGRFKCSSTSVRVVANESPKLNAPPVLIASGFSPCTSRLTSVSLPLSTKNKPHSPSPPSPACHLDSPCNSPTPDPPDSFDGDDGDIEPRLPTSADFAEPVPAFSVISSPVGGPLQASSTEATWKCPVCSVFVPPGNLSQHFTIHNSIRGHNTEPKKYRFCCIRCPNSRSNKLNLFKTRHQLFKHVRQHHPSSYWPCPCCTLLLYSESRFKIHLSHCISKFKISPPSPNICELCGKSFKSIKAYEEHKRQSHPANEIQLKCPKCEKICQQIRSFWRHFVKCGNPQIIAPPISLFPLPASLEPQQSKPKYVKKRHSSGGPIPCDQCGKAFVQECTLNDHIRREHEGESHICPESGCSRNFQSAGKLWRHQTEHHKIADLPPPPGVEVTRCKYCGELVMRGYERHVKKMHSESLEDFKLHVLPEYRRKIIEANLNNPKKPYKNSTTTMPQLTRISFDQIFSKSTDERVQELYKSGRKLKCPLCPKVLLRLSLKKHMFRNHVDPALDKTKVKCNFCPLVLNRDSLKKHMAAKHSGETYSGSKALQCPICKQDFNDMAHYTTHYILRHVYIGVKKILESQKLIMKKKSTNLMVCQICKQEMPGFKSDVGIHFAVSHYDKLLEYYDGSGNRIPIPLADSSKS